MRYKEANSHQMSKAGELGQQIDRVNLSDMTVA
jgi:hypothetical protein